MGNVLIVKNNDKNNNIYDNAYQSYKSKESGEYYTENNTQNEPYVKKIKNRIEGESLGSIRRILKKRIFWRV